MSYQSNAMSNDKSNKKFMRKNNHNNSNISDETIKTAQMHSVNYLNHIHNKQSFGFDDLNPDSNIYVANLPSNYGHNALKELFKGYGEIVRHKFVQPDDSTQPGYGFVQFARVSDAHKAITALENTVFNSGQKIYLSIALRRRSSLTDEPTNLYVKNIPNEWGIDKLKQVFSKYGSIRQSKVMGDGIAFVRYETHEQALNAIDGLNKKEIQGKSIDVRFATRKTAANAYRIGAVPVQKTNENNLYVRNLPKNFGQNELESLFQQFGKISSGKVNENGVAFVRYVHSDDAAKAIKLLNGTKPDGYGFEEEIMVKLAHFDIGDSRNRQWKNSNSFSNVYQQHLDAQMGSRYQTNGYTGSYNNNNMYSSNSNNNDLTQSMNNLQIPTSQPHTPNGTLISSTNMTNGGIASPMSPMQNVIQQHTPSNTTPVLNNSGYHWGVTLNNQQNNNNNNNNNNQALIQQLQSIQNPLLNNNVLNNNNLFQQPFSGANNLSLFTNSIPNNNNLLLNSVGQNVLNFGLNNQTNNNFNGIPNLSNITSDINNNTINNNINNNNNNPNNNNMNVNNNNTNGTTNNNEGVTPQQQQQNSQFSDDQQKWGDLIYKRAQPKYGDLAGKIAGMLLKFGKIANLVADKQLLDQKIDEAFAVLQKTNSPDKKNGKSMKIQVSKALLNPIASPQKSTSSIISNQSNNNATSSNTTPNYLNLQMEYGLSPNNVLSPSNNNINNNNNNTNNNSNNNINTNNINNNNSNNNNNPTNMQLPNITMNISNLSGISGISGNLSPQNLVHLNIPQNNGVNITPSPNSMNFGGNTSPQILNNLIQQKYIQNTGWAGTQQNNNTNNNSNNTNNENNNTNNSNNNQNNNNNNQQNNFGLNIPNLNTLNAFNMPNINHNLLSGLNFNNNQNNNANNNNNSNNQNNNNNNNQNNMNGSSGIVIPNLNIPNSNNANLSSLFMSNLQQQNVG